jgi:hypothetical protein
MGLGAAVSGSLGGMSKLIFRNKKAGAQAGFGDVISTPD